MDARITPFSGRIAAKGLEGRVDAAGFVEPEARQVAGNPFLLDAPGGTRQRQLLAGDGFGLIEARDGWVFGQAAKDGYCGWLPAPALAAPEAATHRVAVRTTWLHPEPGVRPPPVLDLHCNARLRLVAERGAWSEVAVGGATGFVPTGHIRSLDAPEPDPVRVLRLFEGTPYLWAGNTGFGIDCSGLVQAALIACGIACPGDSDLQEAAVGRPLSSGTPLRARDLVFWKGHVAMLADDATLLHANGAAMSVAWERLPAAIARMEGLGLPVRAVRRLD